MVKSIEFLIKQSIVHFDIKTNNIIIDNNNIKIIDFGAALIFDTDNEINNLCKQLDKNEFTESLINTILKLLFSSKLFVKCFVTLYKFSKGEIQMRYKKNKLKF